MDRVQKVNVLLVAVEPFEVQAALRRAQPDQTDAFLRSLPAGAELAEVSPFPGLEFFDEDRAAYFFGREDEVGEARAMLGGASPHWRWLQIDGPSGAGKSSFARAGLVPAVRASGIAGGAKSFWIAVLRPGPDPVASLARALRAALPVLSDALASDEIEANLRARPAALRGLLADHAGGRGVLVLVDQLEEVFTLAGADKAAVERFDALLSEALADAEGPLYLVTTVRSDFTGRMGEPLATLQGHTRSVYRMAFSPDGTRLVTGSEDTTARLWDAKDGKPLATLQGHTASVWAVAFSPDGTRVVTASDDNTARLWDAKTGDLLAILPGHLSRVTSVTFSPDGRHLATASFDGTARIWAATPEGFLIQACQYLHPWPAFAEVAATCAPYLDKIP
jgi:hypothetical protein